MVVIRKMLSAILMMALLLTYSACSDLPSNEASGTRPSPTIAVSSTRVSSSPTSTTSTTSTTSSKVPSTTGSATPKPQEFNVINWILGLGVNAPSGPTNEDFYMYQALSRRECEADGNPARFPVLAAALTACRAAKAGPGARQEWWGVATRVSDATDPTRLSCMDAKAYAVLRALVEAHRKHPNLPFQFASPGPSGRPACLVIAARSPAQGRPGSIITVTGHNLDRAIGVTLSGSGRSTPAQVLDKSDGQLRFKIPQDLTHSGYNFLITWVDASGPTAAWGPLSFGPNDPSQSPHPEESISPKSAVPRPSTIWKEPSTPVSRQGGVVDE